LLDGGVQPEREKAREDRFGHPARAFGSRFVGKRAQGDQLGAERVGVGHRAQHVFPQALGGSSAPGNPRTGCWAGTVWAPSGAAASSIVTNGPLVQRPIPVIASSP